MAQTGMKDVGEAISRSYDERKRRLKELKTETSKVLTGATALLKGYQEAQAGLRDTIAEGRDAWRKTMATLQAKKRQHQKKAS